MEHVFCNYVIKYMSGEHCFLSVVHIYFIVNKV
jgi:hypothetical protein